MENRNFGKGKLVWISYRNDDENIKNGYFYLLEITDNYIKFLTEKNIITIGYDRLLKLKEKNNQNDFSNIILNSGEEKKDASMGS